MRRLIRAHGKHLVVPSNEIDIMSFEFRLAQLISTVINRYQHINTFSQFSDPLL